jgi:hypothetical protein
VDVVGMNSMLLDATMCPIQSSPCTLHLGLVLMTFIGVVLARVPSISKECETSILHSQYGSPVQ